jgi:DNA-binding NtrC family response regulator
MSARVLIVEDEPIIALDLEAILRDAGFRIAGVVGTVARALQVLQTRSCDVAVLDRNVRGESIEGVASFLDERGIPFVYVSGYGREVLSAEDNRAPLLTKPIDPSELVETVNKVLSAAEGDAAAPRGSDQSGE